MRLVAIATAFLSVLGCASSSASPSSSDPSAPAQTGALMPVASPSSTTDATASATAAPTATSDGGPPIGALSAGSYSAHFEPSFTFKIGDGWQRNVPDEQLSDTYLQLLYAAGDGGELLFIEATDLGVEASLERFDQFRLKDVVPAAPATVGGVTGLGISAGHPPAVAVVRGIPPGSDYVLSPNDRIRVVAVEVDTVTVTFIVEASDDDFDAFLILADEVLQSVAFP